MLETITKTHKGEIVIGVDHNLDLLKASTHKDTQEFLDLNFEYKILPCITRPTRITKTNSHLNRQCIY